MIRVVRQDASTPLPNNQLKEEYPMYLALFPIFKFDAGDT